MLSAINLSEFVDNSFTKQANFNFEEFSNVVKEGVKYLNEVLDEGIDLLPLKPQQESARDYRQIGLCVLGIADMLIKLGLKYGSKESLELCDKIGEVLINNAIQQSSLLAKDKGSYPKFSREAVISSPFIQDNCSQRTIDMINSYGLRNSQLLSIAPNGSTSNLLGVSGGIEAIFANSYNRKTESLEGKDKYYKVYTPIVKDYMEEFRLESEEDLPDYFVTAYDIKPKERVDMQAVFQQYIDASISSTINLSEDTTVEEIKDIYLYAWKQGCKGITIYRDGSRDQQVLDTEDKSEVDSDDLPRGYIIDAKDEVLSVRYKLRTGCGSLYVNVSYDDNGKIIETFIESANGGCTASTKAGSRLISLALRAGVSIDEVIDQLKSSGKCSAYQQVKMKRDDVSRGYSCFSAVANVLKKAQNSELAKKLKETTVEKQEDLLSTDIPTHCEAPLCPDCNNELKFQQGCQTCFNCGWSKCD